MICTVLGLPKNYQWKNNQFIFGNRISRCNLWAYNNYQKPCKSHVFKLF